MRAKKTVTTKVYPEQGVTVATLCQIIDWGTQLDKYSGDEGRAKVEFIWELPTQLHTFNEDKGPQPLIVTRKYGNTLGRGSAMKDAIEAMLGQKIDKDFELDSLLDTTCQLNITLEKDGEYTNTVIQSLMPLGKDLAKKKFARYNEQFVFDLDNFDSDTWDLIPEWKQKEIMKSPEYAAIASSNPVPKAKTPPPAAAKSNGAAKGSVFAKDKPAKEVAGKKAKK